MEEKNYVSNLSAKEVARQLAEIKDLEYDIDQSIKECDEILNEEGDE